MAKLIWSFLISVVVLFIAQKIGWISLGVEIPILVEDIFFNQMAWLGVIAIVFTAVSYVGGRLFTMLMLGTCFLGCFTVPIYILAIGYVKLMSVAYFLPGFTYTAIWWKVLILSAFVGVSIPSESSPTSPSS